MKVGDYVRFKSRKVVLTKFPRGGKQTLVTEMMGVIQEDRSPFFRVKWLAGLKLTDESLLSYRELELIPDEELVFLRLKGKL